MGHGLASPVVERAEAVRGRVAAPALDRGACPPHRAPSLHKRVTVTGESAGGSAGLRAQRTASWSFVWSDPAGEGCGVPQREWDVGKAEGEECLQLLRRD